MYVKRILTAVFTILFLAGAVFAEEKSLNIQGTP
jgi:cbb3-type cytochrome oxidase subunit 3